MPILFNCALRWRLKTNEKNTHYAESVLIFMTSPIIVEVANGNRIPNQVPDYGR